MPPLRHFVKKSNVSVSQEENLIRVVNQLVPSVNESGNSWVIKLSGLFKVNKLEAASYVYDLVCGILGDYGDLIEGKSKLASELSTVSDIKIVDNGQTAFIIVSDRKSGDLIRDSLHNYYIGRGCRLKVEFSDRNSLQIELENENSKTIPNSTSVEINSVADQFLNSLFDNLSLVPFNGCREKDGVCKVQVEYPHNIRTIQLINMVVENVLNYGPAFELALMEEEQFNPEFEFLFNYDVPLHVYYRWKLLSIAQSLRLADSDLERSSVSLNDWQTLQRQGKRFIVPIELFPNIKFLPPFPPETLNSEIELVRERLERDVLEREPPVKSMLPFLGEIDNLHLTALLQYCSYERGSIARIMAFAVEHENAAEEVVEIICGVIEDKKVDVKAKISCLWSIGDILLNVDVASEYQVFFKQRLVNTFESLNQCIIDIRKERGRLSGELFTRQLIQVLESWREMKVFVATSAVDFVQKLETLIGKGEKEVDDQEEEREMEEMEMEEEGVGERPEPGQYDGEELTEGEMKFYDEILTVRE